MNYLRNERAFTLIEMIIVMTIISILLLIIVPNMAKNTKVVNKKSCEATIKLLQSQVGVYEMEKESKPTSIEDLAEYVDRTDCPDKTELQLVDGIVTKKP